MDFISLLYKVKQGESLSKLFVRDITPGKVESFQVASLVTFLYERGIKSKDEEVILNHCFNIYPRLAEFFERKMDSDNYMDLLELVRKKRKVPISLLELLISDIVHQKIDKSFLAVWLATVYTKGLANWYDFTLIMMKSGKTFDYRNNQRIDRRKIIRRYPTGALSEKIALIMPSLIASLASEFPIASPFIVAKSLGFTGGTWDKLASIPGFKFPSQGEQTLLTLAKCYVSMTVTQGDYNPADRYLYQFRSVTGTIESTPLIISSIASKQLAVPADYLLMDVRYGNGAFINTRAEASLVGRSITSTLRRNGLKSGYSCTDTLQPNGICIGNYYEILEALSILNPSGKYLEFVDVHALKSQVELVIKMLSKLISEIIDVSRNEVSVKIKRQLDNGDAFRAFIDILKAHNVREGTLDLISNGLPYINHNRFTIDIISLKTGTLIGINQKSLGNFVNFTMANAANEFSEKQSLYNGIILAKRIGDQIIQGETLCKVYCADPMVVDQALIANCFNVI